MFTHVLKYLFVALVEVGCLRRFLGCSEKKLAGLVSFANAKDRLGVNLSGWPGWPERPESWKPLGKSGSAPQVQLMGPYGALSLLIKLAVSANFIIASAYIALPISVSSPSVTFFPIFCCNFRKFYFSEQGQLFFLNAISPEIWQRWSSSCIFSDFWLNILDLSEIDSFVMKLISYKIICLREIWINISDSHDK